MYPSFLKQHCKYKKLEHVIVVPLSHFSKTHRLRQKREQFADFYKTVYSIYVF